MTPERHEKIQEIFQAALDLPVAGRYCIFGGSLRFGFRATLSY
jgi:hypothetical protein